MNSQQLSAPLGAASLFNVNGLVAVITGGGTGIGLMMTTALIQNGAAKVYVLGRRLGKLQEAVASIGQNVIAVKCDVTSKSDLQAAVRSIEEDAGYVNLLVCNSGITGPEAAKVNENTTLEQFADSNFNLDIDAYTQAFAVNVTGVWYTTLAFLKLLDKGNKHNNMHATSQVVITSSIAAFNKRSTAGYAYGQSKAAAVQAMKQLANQLTQWGIRANAILPGLFPSEMSAPALENFKSAAGEYRNIPSSMVPINRLGDEKDMGGTLLFLASRAGAYVNGVALMVDGGRLGNFPSTF